MPKYNPRLQKAIFDVIDNQIKGNDPPETRETFNRLVREGHSKTETRKLIGCAIAVELYDIMKHRSLLTENGSSAISQDYPNFRSMMRRSEKRRVSYLPMSLFIRATRSFDCATNSFAKSSGSWRVVGLISKAVLNTPNVFNRDLWFVLSQENLL